MGLGLQPPELTHSLYPIRKQKEKAPKAWTAGKIMPASLFLLQMPSDTSERLADRKTEPGWIVRLMESVRTQSCGPFKNRLLCAVLRNYFSRIDFHKHKSK